MSLFCFLVIVMAHPAFAAGNAFSFLEDSQGLSQAVKILILLTLLTFLPALVLIMTSFTRLVVVFSLLRQALGTQQAPPNQIIVGLSLFLTFFIMSPVFTKVHHEALAPYLEGHINEGEALDKALPTFRTFMLRETRAKDLQLFQQISKAPLPKTLDEIPTTVVIPAFITSELKTSFEIAFLLYIPFLVIDMVVASVLMSLGMMLLPPIMISLPFKLMLFVLVDGWNLVVDSMVRSF
jgi:flagellar biosynthetic protein FliP